VGGIDWDAHWRVEPLRPDAVDAEERTPRWRGQEALVHRCFGSFEGLRVIEIGAGRGLNGLLYARRGAAVTLLDESELVLAQAEELAAACGVRVEALPGDALEPSAELLGQFDVSMSFGLCEHFVGDDRLRIVSAHLELLRRGGIAFLGVPNRLAPFYRVWMAVLKARGTWPLGVEVPFGVGELTSLARAGGGEPMQPVYGSFVASAVGHGLNQVLFKLGRGGLRVPQPRMPILDRFAYELLLPVRRA
jgi:SAM-dependent methyltransferase